GVAGVEQLDRLAQPGIMIDPFLLDRLQPILVTLQGRLDRLKQRLQLRLALLAGLVEAGVGALEELLLRLGEQFRPDLVELGRKRLLGLDQLLQPRLEVARVGLERRNVAQRLVARPGDFGKIGPELVRCPAPFVGKGAGAAASDQPAERHADYQGSDREQHRYQRIHLKLPTERTANLEQRMSSLKRCDGSEGGMGAEGVDQGEDNEAGMGRG